MTREEIKIKPSIWRRMDIQVSLFTAIVVTLLTFSIFWFQYRIAYSGILISLRDQAESIYGYVEKRLNEGTFDQIRIREDMGGDVYKQAHRASQRIREISGARYLYAAGVNEDGEFVYLIDCPGQSEPDFHCSGDLIEYEIYPDVQRALDGQRVLPDRIKDTERGEIFITYMPIYNGEQVLGVVGIEFEAGHQYDTYRSLCFLLPLFILLFNLGVCLTFRLPFRRIPNPFYRDMSNTDYLAQSKNRNVYQLDIGDRIAGKAQEGTGFILLDLNNLKHVSGTLGHDTGGVYITCIPKAYLNMRIREAVTYRIGDSEFVVVIPGVDRDKIQDLMRRFRDMLDREASMPEFTSSWGYSIYNPKADTDLYSMCRRADRNMYMRKRQYYKNKNTQEGTDETVG